MPRIAPAKSQQHGFTGDQCHSSGCSCKRVGAEPLDEAGIPRHVGQFSQSGIRSGEGTSEPGPYPPMRILAYSTKLYVGRKGLWNMELLHRPDVGIWMQASMKGSVHNARLGFHGQKPELESICRLLRPPSVPLIRVLLACCGGSQIGG